MHTTLFCVIYMICLGICVSRYSILLHSACVCNVAQCNLVYHRESSECANNECVTCMCVQFVLLGWKCRREKRRVSMVPSTCQYMGLCYTVGLHKDWVVQ